MSVVPFARRPVNRTLAQGRAVALLGDLEQDNAARMGAALAEYARLHRALASAAPDSPELVQAVAAMERFVATQQEANAGELRRLAQIVLASGSGG